MKIEHAAIWTNDIERMKNFYIKYFNGISGEKYVNLKKGFSSYFIKFGDGARLEIMNNSLYNQQRNIGENPCIGLAHIAFSVGSRERVDELTEMLKNDGYEIVGGPRITGDGYYESCILDHELNQIEITV